MSPKPKSFEGPDVQLLLDQIRREVGLGAKINGAEKIRVGGVLGFFAREHYRVLVEAPAPMNVAPGGGTQRDGVALSPSEPSVDEAYDPVGGDRTPQPGPTADPFPAMTDATDDVNDVALAPPVPAGAPADGFESFDAVLSRIACTLGDVDDVLGRVATAAAATLGDTTVNGHVGGPGHRPWPSPVVTPDPPAPAEEVSADGVLPDTAPPGNASNAAMFLAGNVAGSGDATLEALRRAGLDPDTVAALSEGLRRGGTLEALLLEAFGRLDAAPPLPRRVGSLLVVAGSGAPAREFAGAVAVEIGSDPAEVAFASLDPLADTVVRGKACVRSAEEAAELAPGWRRSQAAVVVVDAPVTDAQRSWATHVITSLRPTAVWGLVDATLKAEDICAWAAALGGLDALAVENLGATVSPATVLGVGIPVARLDGRPASASRWTATIVDRIDPCP